MVNILRSVYSEEVLLEDIRVANVYLRLGLSLDLENYNLENLIQDERVVSYLYWKTVKEIEAIENGLGVSMGLRDLDDSVCQKYSKLSEVRLYKEELSELKRQRVSLLKTLIDSPYLSHYHNRPVEGLVMRVAPPTCITDLIFNLHEVSLDHVMDIGDTGDIKIYISFKTVVMTERDLLPFRKEGIKEVLDIVYLKYKEIEFEVNPDIMEDASPEEMEIDLVHMTMGVVSDLETEDVYIKITCYFEDVVSGDNFNVEYEDRELFQELKDKLLLY